MSPELRALIAAAEESVEDRRKEYPEEPPRWRDCGCAGPLTEKLADALEAYKNSIA